MMLPLLLAFKANAQGQRLRIKSWSLVGREVRAIYHGALAQPSYCIEVMLGCGEIYPEGRGTKQTCRRRQPRLKYVWVSLPTFRDPLQSLQTPPLHLRSA